MDSTLAAAVRAAAFVILVEVDLMEAVPGLEAVAVEAVAVEAVAALAVAALADVWF